MPGMALSNVAGGAHLHAGALVLVVEEVMAIDRPRARRVDHTITRDDVDEAEHALFARLGPIGLERLDRPADERELRQFLVDGWVAIDRPPTGGGRHCGEVLEVHTRANRTACDG